MCPGFGWMSPIKRYVFLVIQGGADFLFTCLLGKTADETTNGDLVCLSGRYIGVCVCVCLQADQLCFSFVFLF